MAKPGEVCGHDGCEGIVQEVPAKEATCTTEGNTSGAKCGTCGYVHEVSAPIAKKGHTPATVKGKAATCTSTGLTDGAKCSVCGEITKAQETIAALGHNWGADGGCTRCDAVQQTDGPGEKIGTPSDDTAPTESVPEESLPEESLPEESLPEDSLPGETGAAISVTEEVIAVPVVEEEKSIELFKCNPFECGCWLYLLLALVIGVVLGFVLGSNTRKKSRKGKHGKHGKSGRSKPVVTTTMEQAVDFGTVMTESVIPVTQSATGVTAAVHHHIGARKDQQDSYGVSDLNAYGTTGVLAIVADGMGGLANGKAVSSNLVYGMLNYFRQTTGQESVPDMMLDMLTQSNDQINHMLQGADRSGSTLVSAIVRQGHLHFLTVGDSRIYLYRHGSLLQLNREHIYQEELALKAVNHIVPLAQVTGDRQAHALTSYLGIGRLTHLDRNYEGIKLEPGDKLLLASDGVFGTLSQAEMEEALRNGIGDATDIIGEKIRLANMQYQDNNTALVLEYHG